MPSLRLCLAALCAASLLARAAIVPVVLPVDADVSRASCALRTLRLRDLQAEPTPTRPLRAQLRSDLRAHWAAGPAGSGDALSLVFSSAPSCEHPQPLRCSPAPPVATSAGGVVAWAGTCDVPAPGVVYVAIRSESALAHVSGSVRALPAPSEPSEPSGSAGISVGVEDHDGGRLSTFREGATGSERPEAFEVDPEAVERALRLVGLAVAAVCALAVAAGLCGCVVCCLGCLKTAELAWADRRRCCLLFSAVAVAALAVAASLSSGFQFHASVHF
eukprot:m51a1_g10335 hypothetical protein (275) ;mRNA; f:110018-110842